MRNVSYMDSQIKLVNFIEFYPDSEKFVTLVYLLAGSVRLTLNGKQSELHAGRVVVINKGDQARFWHEEKNMAVVLEIACDYFFQQYRDFYSTKFTLPDEECSNYARVMIEQMRVKLASMAIASIRTGQNGHVLEMSRCLSEIMLTLVRYFNSPRKECAPFSVRYSKRIEQVIAWMTDNYRRPISLTEAADRVFVSFSYLSRLFIKEVGINFSDYLRQLRFQHCLHEIATGNDSISRIALQQGFTNVRQLTLLCKRHYGKTPVQIRRDYKTGVAALPSAQTAHVPPAKGNRFGPVDLVDAFPLLTAGTNPQCRDTLAPYMHNEEQRVIVPARGKGHAPKEPLAYIVTIGGLEEVLKDSIQRQLHSVKEQIGAYYLDCYDSIFSRPVPDIYALPPKTFHTVCYSETERALAYLNTMDIPLVVRIGQDVTLAILDGFLRYCVNAFSREWLQRWRFIVYPAACAKPQDDAEHFRHISQLINRWLGAAKLGVFLSLPDEITDFSAYLTRRHDSLKQADFIGYCANANLPNERRLASHYVFTQSEMHISRVTEALSRELRTLGLLTPLCLVEWNTLTGSSYRTNGSFFRGALIFNTLMTLPAQVCAVNVWLNLESQRWALQDIPSEIGSLALFHVFNIPRPVFHAIRLRERLKGEVLTCGSNYLVTMTDFGYQLVLSNTITFDPQLTAEEDLFSCFKKQITLKVMNFQPGLYRIKRWQFDQQHGALFWQLEQTSTCYWWDDEIVETINRNTVPTLSVVDEHIAQEWVTVNKLDINALMFYELYRVY